MRYADSVKDPLAPNVAALDLSDRIGRVAAPLRQQVLEVLRDAILEFQLKPGQRLIERELIEFTGVSRTTIREVLRELAAEGLVKTIPQKGAVVVVPSPEEAAELYEIRGLLEGRMARLFVERASSAQVGALRKAFDAIDQATGRGAGTATILKAKNVFYDVLGKGAGNHSLAEMVAQLHARVSLIRATSLSSADARPRAAADELRDVVEAVEARDAGRAEAAIARHVENAAAAGVAGLAGWQGAPPISR